MDNLSDLRLGETENVLDCQPLLSATISRYPDAIPDVAVLQHTEGYQVFTLPAAIYATEIFFHLASDAWLAIALFSLFATVVESSSGAIAQTHVPFLFFFLLLFFPFEKKKREGADTSRCMSPTVCDLDAARRAYH